MVYLSEGGKTRQADGAESAASVARATRQSLTNCRRLLSDFDSTSWAAWVICAAAWSGGLQSSVPAPKPAPPSHPRRPH